MQTKRMYRHVTTVIKTVNSFHFKLRRKLFLVVTCKHVDEL